MLNNLKNSTTMKTIKSILLIFVLSCSTMLMATEYKLHQTSSSTYKSVSSSGLRPIYAERPLWEPSVHMPYGKRVTTPVVSFQSTSAVYQSTTSLPSAAVSGVVLVDDMIDKAGSPRGPRRLIEEGDENEIPENWADPMPIGDMPVWMVLLLAFGYAALLTLRKMRIAKA